jgi:hypothetical protein
MAREPYVAQLLPTLEEARVIRAALSHYVQCDPLADKEEDIAWKILAELTSKMTSG